MELNRPAPDFTLPDLDGRLHRLRDYRGRIVVISFWSAECPWVERVDKELLACLQKWGERVVLLAIAVDPEGSNDLVTASARTRGLPLVLRCRPGLSSRMPAGEAAGSSGGPGQGVPTRGVVDAYQAQITPHHFVVDPDGILRYSGAFDDVTLHQRTPTHFYLKDAVEALLSGRLPDPAETPAYGCVIVRHLPNSC